MKKKHLIIVLLVLTCFGCRRTQVIDIPSPEKNSIDDRLLNANRYIASSEQTQIQGYASRRGWKMEQLPCGAWLQCYSQGTASPIGYEDRVVVRYRVSTLTDIVLYDWREDTLTVGRREATVALDEALMRMRPGSKAHLLTPSEAAYGVMGDGDRVPSRTVLRYDITATSILNR